MRIGTTSMASHKCQRFAQYDDAFSLMIHLDFTILLTDIPDYRK